MHVLADVPKGWKSYFEPPADYTIRTAWDVHGARKPQACLFVATGPDGTVFVYDELYNEPLIKPNAKAVKRKLENRFCATYLIDPRALIVNPVTETADVLDALAEEDLYYEPGSKDMISGISAVKEKLSERHSASSLPTIYFSPNLTRTLFEFTHYVYDIEKNEPKDKDDDMMENLRRLVLNGLDYIKPPSDADYRTSRATNIGFAEQRNGFSIPQNLLK
jgi:hypothetical protein